MRFVSSFTVALSCLLAVPACQQRGPMPAEEERQERPRRPPDRTPDADASETADSRGLAPIDKIPDRPAYYRATWAVVIGIDAYPGGAAGLAPLKYAVNDAREVRDILRDEFGYAEDHLLFLSDRTATLQATKDALIKWLPAQPLVADDAVLLFFSGHGLIDRQTDEGFLAAVDSDSRDLPQRCLPVAWIRDRLAELPCRHKLIVLDTCYSGSLFQEMSVLSAAGTRPHASGGPQRSSDAGPSTQVGATRGATSTAAAAADSGLGYYLSRPAFLGMSAGRIAPVADGDSANNHSPFTSEFLAVLRERANSPHPDRTFTLRDLAAQVESRVRSDPASRQIPNFGRLGPGDGDFLFRPTVERSTPRELAEREAYAQQLSQAYATWENNQVAQAERILAGCPEPLRGWEWHYLQRLCHADLLTLHGHASAVNWVAFSPDGTWLASGSGLGVQSGEVILWDAKTGQRRPHAAEHLLLVSSVSFSPDSRRLASAGKDGRINIWDLRADERALTIDTQQGPVYCVAYSSDGTQLASAGEDHTVRIWEAASGERQKSLGDHTGAVRTLAFSPDAQWLVSAGDDGRILVWDWPVCGPPRVLDGPGSAVKHVAFCGDSQHIASCDIEGNVRVRDVATGRVAFAAGRPGVNSVAFSPDGSHLALACADHRVELRDLSTGRVAAELRGHSGSVVAVIFDPDGQRIATASADATVKVWAVAGDPDQIVYRGHSAKVKVNDVTFSPDGRLAASAAEDGSVHVWQPADGKPIHAWQAHTRALCLRFSRDGRRLATGGADGMLKIWDCATWQLVREMGVFSGLVGRIECVAFSPDGSLIAAGSDDKKVTLWNVDDGTRVGTFRDHTHRVNALAFSPDGQRILSAAGTVVPPTEPEWYLWNVSTRQRQRTFSLAGRPGTAEDAAYSRDGRWLAAAGPDHLVRVWDADTGRLVFQGEGPSGHAPYREAQGGPRQKNFTVGVSFSPDGRRLASADRAQVVKIWDTLSGLPLLSLPPLQTRVSAVAFSPDGQRLAVAGHDGTVRTLAATWP